MSDTIFKPLNPGDQPLNRDDEGELDMRTGLDEERGVFVVDFGKPVLWVGMQLEQVEYMQARLAEAATKLRALRERQQRQSS